MCLDMNKQESLPALTTFWANISDNEFLHIFNGCLFTNWSILVVMSNLLEYK